MQKNKEVHTSMTTTIVGILMAVIVAAAGVWAWYISR